jgi:hypothetical protein
MGTKGKVKSDILFLHFQVPFRLGPCPTSYLERDQPQQQPPLQRQRPMAQNGIWGNVGGGNASGADILKTG